MSRIVDKLRGREPERWTGRLPLEIDAMSEGDKRRALDARVAEIRRLPERAKTASTSEREAILERGLELRDDIRRLENAGVGKGTAPVRGGAAILEARARQMAGDRQEETEQERVVRILVDVWYPPAPLVGLKLRAERITPEEARELKWLLEARYGENPTGWSEEQEGRFEAIVEKLAGRPAFQEMRTEEEIAEILEEVRRESLPRRREYAQAGSVHLPAGLFDELREAARRGSAWTVGDVGVRASLLWAFDVRDATIFDRARFDTDAQGEPVLTAKGRELRVASRLNSPPDAIGGSRVTVDHRYLEQTGWFKTTRGAGGRLEVRYGPRAKRLRRGEPT
jgi:hypothetical protein